MRSVSRIAQIEVKQVSLTRGKQLWSYPDLTILAGEKILITGDSGSGKSTLLKLLLGDLQAEKGQIKTLLAKPSSRILTQSAISPRIPSFSPAALPKT